MDSQTLQEFKAALEAKRAQLERDLERFARKDVRTPGDYDTRYPQFSAPEGQVDEESEQDELEEYANRLPVEHALEKDLAAVRAALNRIEAGAYGVCSRCGNEIAAERLRALPEAEECGCT